MLRRYRSGARGAQQGVGEHLIQRHLYLPAGQLAGGLVGNVDVEPERGARIHVELTGQAGFRVEKCGRVATGITDLDLEDDLVEVLNAAAAGNFGATTQLRFRREAAACIVLASEGYPDQPAKGAVIGGLERAAALPGVEIFHAGTSEDESGAVVVAGGRVIDACATGATLRDALRAAYAAAAEIDWPGKVYRRDIGKRVLERVSEEA